MKETNAVETGCTMPVIQAYSAVPTLFFTLMHRVKNAAMTKQLIQPLLLAVCKVDNNMATPKLMLRGIAVEKVASTVPKVLVVGAFFILALPMANVVELELCETRTKRCVVVDRCNRKKIAIVFAVVAR